MTASLAYLFSILTVNIVHENLINRASCIIIVTADANRNLYQTGFAKHVDMMCSMLRTRGQKKSLIVVAVSSPYDFAMDKSIGTYLCTFDFTETAMHALVRAMLGEYVPKGTLPGTLRKSRRAMKSRQHWLVEEYDRDRDSAGLDSLIQAVARASEPDYQYLGSTSAASLQLFNPNIEESHFVVRNSSTQALYGFVATYAIKGTGILGAIIVDPAKRNVAIGRSLQRRALRNLVQKRGIKKIQLGMSFPGVFLGIPIDESGVKTWFANGGWDVQFPKRLTNMIIRDLSGWSAPEGLLQSIQRASLSFDLIHGLDNAESVLSHVEKYANPEVLELYKFALQETKACGIVRAKGPSDNLLGTIIICRQGSPLATYIPPLQSNDDDIGGILAPVVPPTPQAPLVLQGLALMGIRQNKAHKSGKTVISWVRYFPDASFKLHRLTMARFSMISMSHF
jgi:beta-N-acetylhexosaminidase